MARRRQTVKNSWAGQFAKQASNRRFLNEIESYDYDLQKELQDSADRNARLQYDIERTRADIKALEEDPDGYFYEKEQQALENEQWSVGNYFKNWWASHGRKMNDFQIADFQGYMDRSNQWERLANDVKTYWDIEDEIKNLDSQIAQQRLNTQNLGKAPTSKMREAYGIIDLLQTQKDQLSKRLDELKPSVDAFKTYIPGSLRSRYYDIVAGNGENGIFSNSRLFGRTSQAHDELGDITRFTTSIFSDRRTRGEQREMLDRALKAKQEKYKEWQAALDENIKDRESYNKVAKWFQNREQRAGTDIFNSDTWLYGMPGLIAGSTSGLSKAIPAMITGALTASAVAATGGTAGVAIGAVGGLGSYGLNYGAGVSENNAEVSMEYNNRLEDYLKSQKTKRGSLYDDIVYEGRKKLGEQAKNYTDEQVFEQYRAGRYNINNAEANKKMTQLAIGIESQFQDDMMATTWSAGIETLLEIIPVGKVLSTTKMAKGKMANLAKGYKIGAAAGPIAGAVYAPIHAALQPTMKKAGKMVSSIAADLAKTAHIVDAIPSKLLKKKFLGSTTKRYIKDISGRLLLASAAEGIEEGKQSISANRYASGYYTDAKIKSIGETILDDFLAGSKSAGLLLGMPLEGLMSDSDRKILQEIKGGFLLGGLQTGMVNVSSSIYPYVKEQKANNVIANNVLIDKAAKIDKLKKSALYSESAKSSSAYQNIIDGFARLRQENENVHDSTGEYGISPESIDEEEKTFKDVARMSIDPYTIKQAQYQGIKPSSKEYNQFVAIKSLSLDELDKTHAAYEQADERLWEVRRKIKESILIDQVENTDESGKEQPNPAARYSSLKNYIQLKDVAKYTALLRRKEQLEVGIMNAENGDHPEIKKILSNNLSKIQDQINNLKGEIQSYTNAEVDTDINSVDSVEKSLVLDKTIHDELSEAYRASIVARQDFDLALDQYETIVGNAYIDGKEADLTENVNWDEILDKVTFKGGDAASVIKQYEETIDDDNDLASTIDEHFDTHTDDNGNEIVTEDADDEVPANNPDEEFHEDLKKDIEKQQGKPVEQAPVEPIQKPSEPVSQPQPTAVPEQPLQQPQQPLHKATKNQQAVVDKVKTFAEQSKKNVKSVSPENYVIEVDGKDITMPRVHSVMPKYWAQDGSFQPALQVGNAFDNLARTFFGDKSNIDKYQTNRDSLIDALYNQYASNKDSENDTKKTYSQLYSSKESFAQTIDDLYNLAKQYDQLGWELSTEPVVWYADFGNGYIAGETDMLAIDENGNVHIIDFKTASYKEGSIKNPFGHYETYYGFSIGNDLENRMMQLSKDDFQVGPRKMGLSKAARQFIRDVRERTKNPNIKVEWDDQKEQAVLKYINSDYSNVGSSSFRQTHVYNGTTKGSKQDEYSDQLTAYKEIIQRKLANVVDMEVIGFRADYKHADNNLQSISSIRNSVGGKPFRVKVSFSDEMHDILNNEGDAVEPQQEVGPSTEETVEQNQNNDTVATEELKNSDKTNFQSKQQDVISDTNEQPLNIEVQGYSNMNPNVLNRERKLVDGMVFDKNFIADAIQNGTVEVYTEVVTDRIKGTSPSVYANITYKGKTYNRVFIYATPSLLNKVQLLEKTKQPGQKIIATNITRTNGTVVYGKTRPALDTNLVDQDIKEVSFDSSDMQFGYIKNGNVVAFTGGNQKLQDVIYKFENANVKNGTLVYLKRVPRSDSEGGDKFIPVTLRQKSLGADADFIIETLQHIDLLDTPYIVKTKNGEVQIGATRRELLNLLIPFADDASSTAKTYSIRRNANVPSVFEIISPDNQIQAIVDLRDEGSIKSFKKALQSIQMVDNPDVLTSNIGSPNAAKVFVKIKKFFANNKDGIKTIDVSNSIKFDFEDFKDNGLSGIGWYLKRGMLVTDYERIDAPMVSINDVGISTQQSERINKEEDFIGDSSVDAAVRDVTIDDLIAVQWKTKQVKDSNKPLLTEQSIKKHLRPILGDVVDDPNVVTIMATIANDPRIKNAKVVGKATSDAITLYNEAFDGVDYHEAFHRIFELFVPKATRDSIYEKTAQRIGVDLKQSNESTDFIGHRQVAEWLADKYMESRRYNVNTGIQWLDKLINYIVDLVRSYCSISNRDLYRVFLDINSGKYKNQKKASKENVERFEKLFKNLNYEIHGQQFDHILNDQMYDEVKNSALYCLLRGQKVDVSGSTVQDIKINPTVIKRGADTLKPLGFDVFGTDIDPDKKSAAQLAMTEMVVRFDAVADDLAAMVSAISTDYRKIMQQEGIEDFDGGEAASSYDENFFKWSYEFDKFDKTTSRIKFFFATVPDTNLNSLGLPQFLPMNYVFNEVLCNLWDVDTIEEVKSRLQALSAETPMYKIILNNIDSILKRRYNEDGTVNADAEALIAQLMTTIRSNRHTFMLLRSKKNKDGTYNLVMQRSDSDYNARAFTRQWSQILAKGGSETLKVNEYGDVVFNPKNPDAARTFKTIARLFNQIKDAVSAVNNGVGEIIIPSYEFPQYEYEDSIGNRIVTSAYLPNERVQNITEKQNCDKVKSAIIDALNRIGINIHAEEFDYMLQHKYGCSNWEALKQMVQSTDSTDSISSFMFFLNNISRGKSLNLNADGTFVTQNNKNVPFDSIYTSMAFVKELGNWKYEYRHAHDTLSVLAIGGDRFYEISDNDYMSDVVRNLNKRGKWFTDLKQDLYNYYTTVDNYGETQQYGSITLKQLTDNKDAKLQIKHFIGFKTDKKGDEGHDYFKIVRREDYLAKAGMLENGAMISLTLSDKKKYCYITGVKLPGIDYTEMQKAENPIIDLNAASQKIFVPDNISSSVYTIQQREDVVNQFLSYAISEYQSILRNAERIDDGHRKVANFDTNEQSVKFSSLLGVWEQQFDENGKPTEEKYISFNNKNKSWKKNLETAQQHFFNKPEKEQKALIARNLSKLAERELNTMQALGLIQKVADMSNPFINYKNVGLNDNVIKSIKVSYMQAMKNEPLFTEQMAESMAISAYVNDISNKAIMSGQEMERLFSGNPAFYKWRYDDKGRLVDRTVDELKRLGGLGSTGINNFTQLANIPSKYKKDGNFTGKYVVAEVDNEMVSSPQYKEISDKMYQGQVRWDVIENRMSNELATVKAQHEAAMRSIRRSDGTFQEIEDALEEERNNYQESLEYLEDKIAHEVDNMSIEDLEKEYPEIAKEARIKSDDTASALQSDIDVADGGAYISDVMCEMLLKMEGAYNSDIEEAFKILRGEIKSNYLGEINAYQKVLTSVIGSQKYTAFGRRLSDGKSKPYYHKMALFPLFDCIATGRMRDIYDKMRQQGIDMLLVNSAVKVGSEGSKSIDWGAYRQDGDPANEDNFNGDIANQDWKPSFEKGFSFDTYECEFDYLRKQLNTDPKEEALLRMGTQSQKIVFSNIVQGRDYVTQEVDSEGKPVTIKGRDLLGRIMDSFNRLSDIGVQKINKAFFLTNDNNQLVDRYGNVIEDQNSNDRELDIVKFSKEVSKLMSDRGADKNIMRALELVTSNDTKHLSIPLGAISNANWLESVLISHINKDVIDVNTPGAYFIQRSIWAMQGNRLYTVKPDADAKTLYKGKRLQMVNEEGSMDCVLSIDFFDHMLPEVWTGDYETDEDGNYIYEKDENGVYKLDDKYGKNYVPKKKMRGMTFEEAREWLVKKGIIGGKANIVSYRIPTQAESSIHALRCVDVLPVVRDTVILPEEFTKITGSDFDIDKLGLSTVNYNKYGSDKFKEGSEEYYQNRIIRDFITLLIDKKSQHILQRSIDKDTKLLKDVLKTIETSSSKEEMPYQFYTLSTQTERKGDYVTGKLGIGPFALNNNNHILTMLYGVKFKNIEGSIMNVLGLTDLSIHSDVDGNSIMSWLSALINAHVDIAKDPYISRLNVNPFTYNLVNTLIRTGFGKRTFFFTTQPIMKELATAYNNAASSYMADQYKSRWQLQKEAVEAVAEQNFKDIKINKWSFEDIVEGISNPKDTTYKPIINKYIKALVDNNILEKTANVRRSSSHVIPSIFNKDEQELLSADQIQMLVYFAYLQFEPYASSVSNLVKYSKIDTNKHGKSYIEQQIYLEGFNRLFNNPDGSGLFEREGLTKLAEHSYIETKTVNAISMTKNILKGQFLQSTNGFDNAVHRILDMIGNPDSISVTLWDSITKGITASIKSEFINEYAKSLPQYNATYMRDLVSESEEDLEYTQAAGSNRLKVISTPKYNLKTYIRKPIRLMFQYGGKDYSYDYTVLGYDEKTNEIIIDKPSKVDIRGKMHISGGENTICDRFNRLNIELRSDDKYADVLDGAKEPNNMLLKSLELGNEFVYTPPMYQYTVKKEVPDTYNTLKFIKLFNALDQNGIQSNYIIDAWDQLLHDRKHPELARFAEDLVVYAFITSGDSGGFTKFFKQVPFSWRKESGYADFINRKLVELQSIEIPNEQLEDIILNNWFDNQLVPKYDLYDDKHVPNFISYSGATQTSGYIDRYSYPRMLAALKDNGNGKLKATIDPNNAPLFIKIPRRRDSDAKDSQRRVTVYKRVSYGMRQGSAGIWVHYPIYVEVQQKGNLIRGNYLITEYGREDSPIKDYGPNVEGLKKMFALGDFISRNVIEDYRIKYTNSFSQMIEDMNYQYLLENKFHATSKLADALKQRDTKQEEMPVEESLPKEAKATNLSFYSGMITPDENTIFVFGSNPEGRHGAGAAKVAREKFGAVYGQGEGLQGNSYALPTKDLRIKENRGLRSISPEQITENIRKMYEVARQNPNRRFKVAYTNNLNETSLNGYTGAEMIEMFKNAGPIPSNVMFSENWKPGFEQRPVTISEGLTQEQIDELKKEAEEIKKQCKGE